VQPTNPVGPCSGRDAVWVWLCSCCLILKSERTEGRSKK
jgi:hypothetical protein